LRKLEFNRNWPEEYKRLWQYDNRDTWNSSIDPPSFAFHHYRSRIILSWIKQLNARKVLDIGAGKANISLILAEHGAEVLLNDIDPQSLEYAMLKYEKGNVRLLPGNVEKLDPKENFDLILLMEVLEHFAHPDRLLNKIYNWLSDTGHVLITTPNGSFFRNHLSTFSQIENKNTLESCQFGPDAEHHLFLFTFEELVKISIHSGYTVKKHTYIGTPIMNGPYKIGIFVNLFPLSIRFLADHILSRIYFYQKKLAVSQAILLQKSKI